MSLQKKIERIEAQLTGSLPVPETSETKWAFNLARKRFETPFDEMAKRVQELFKKLSSDPSSKNNKIEDVPNPYYEADPKRRAVKIQEYASELVRKYSDMENYQRIMNETCPAIKHFQFLKESNERQRAPGEPVN